MVAEVVVKEALSGEMMSAGAELTRRLDEARFNVSASFWFYIPETNTWRFVIGSPGVRTQGPKKAYRQVQSVVSKMSDEQPKISLKDITVLDSNDPLISLIRTAVKTRDRISGIRFTHNGINGMSIEDAYIYRMT